MDHVETDVLIVSKYHEDFPILHLLLIVHSLICAKYLHLLVNFWVVCIHCTLLLLTNFLIQSVKWINIIHRLLFSAWSWICVICIFTFFLSEPS